MHTFPVVWGMIHIPALPGSPNNKLNLREIEQWIIADATTLVESGITHLVLENFGDVPFFKDTNPPYTIAFMTRLGKTLLTSFQTIELGINILRNDSLGALAVAKALERVKFIRVNVLTGAYITDQGLIEGNAAILARQRKELAADYIEIWADLNVKHSMPLVQRDPLVVAKEMLNRAGAAKIILTGSASGMPVSEDLLNMLSQHFPKNILVIGSGITKENITSYTKYADNIIVGTSIKKDKNIFEHIDKRFVSELVNELQ